MSTRNSSQAALQAQPQTSGRYISLLAIVGFFGLLVMGNSGCWAPFRSPGIPASSLPDSFRTPMRTAGAPLNYSHLTIQPPADYILGPNDILEITIPGLFEGAEVRPLRVQIMASGEVQLPLVGPVMVGSKNLLQAQQDITAAYEQDFLVNPRISVTLAEKSSTSVLVLGKVKLPGVHVLPKYENDVGHALGAAGGLLEESADVIEVHRRIPSSEPDRPQQQNAPLPPEHPIQLSSFVDPTSAVTYWGRDGVTYHTNDQGVLGVQKGDSVSLVSASQRSGHDSSHSIASSTKLDSAFSENEQTAVTNAMGSVRSNSETSSHRIAPPLQTMQGPSRIPSDNTIPHVEFLPSPEYPLNVDGSYLQSVHAEVQGDRQILRIPLRQNGPNQLSAHDVRLQPGDVVVVPSRRHEVFYVVGQLNQTNSVRFTIGDRERELGVGFILPREREIDVVTAVVMAGYIDPIDSPTTVTVQRRGPDGRPLLIHVDLIRARCDARETVLVQPGDIIYLNPDSSWWLRRTFDRVVPSLIIDPFRKSLGFN